MSNVVAEQSPAVLRSMRNIPLDDARVLLAVMVVGLHGQFLMDSEPALGNVLVNYLFRLAVPFFFMVNGYFLFELTLRGGSVLSWAKRILVLYVTWTLVYAYFIASSGIANAFLQLLRGYWHLWYLPATLAAGLLVYTIRAWPLARVVLALVSAYFAGVALQYAGKYHLFSGFADEALNFTFVYRNFLFFGTPMLGTGFIMAKLRLPQRVGRRALYLLLGFGAITMAAEWVVNTKLRMPAGQSIDLLLSLPLIDAPLLALLLKTPSRPTSLNRAGISGVIYFAHPLFLLLLRRAGVDESTLVVCLSIAGCFALYPAIALLNRKWSIFF